MKKTELKKPKSKKNNSNKKSPSKTHQPVKSPLEIPNVCCLSEFFFCQFNRIIDIGKKGNLRQEEMFLLPPGTDGYNVLPKAILARESQRKRREMEQMKPKKCLFFKNKFDLMDLNSPNSVQGIIFELIKPKIIRAILLRITDKFLILLLSLIPLWYLPQLKKKPGDRNDYILFYSPLVCFLLTFLREIVKEHCAKFLCQCGSATGQTLRTLFYDKIINSNISFLENADSSIIAKITLFEINKISDFVGKVPDVVSFPATLTMSAIAMVYFISWTTLIMLVIFIITFVILTLLAKKQSYHNERKEYFGSRRALKINEILANMEQMKCSSMESYMNESIKQLRKLEITCIIFSNNFKALASFVMSISPIGAILIIIMLERQVVGRDLTVTQTFAIVSIVNNLSKPLRELVTIMDQYYFYKHAADAMNKILFVFSLRPEDSEIDESLRKGEIIVEGCTTEIEDSKDVIRMLGKVFGDQIDVEEELKKASLKMEKIAKLRNTGPVQSPPKGKEKVDKKRASIFHNIKKGVSFGVKNIKGGLSNLNLFGSKKAKQVMDVQRKTLHKNITLKINPKEKLCLVGDSNQHITEFLYAILGEVFITEGSIRYNGDIYYLDGKNPSFLVHQSLRDNIIFGEKYDRNKFFRTLEMSGLDVSKYTGKEMMQIMEKGNNLSRAEIVRLLVSRMLYQPERDIYIISRLFEDLTDDYVREIYSKIFKSEFFKSKTLIFRSNSRLVAKLVDRIIVFDERKIVFDGNPGDFIIKFSKNLKRGGETPASNLRDRIKKVVKADKIRKMNFGDFKEKSENLMEVQQNKIKEYIKKEAPVIKKSESRLNKFFRQRNNKLKNKEGDFAKKSKSKTLLELMAIEGQNIPQRLQAENERQTFDEEGVYKNIYKLMKQYVLYGGKCRIISLFIFYTISICLFVSVDVWAGAWSFSLFDFSARFYMLMYIILTLAAGLFVILRDNFFYNIIMRNTNKVHDLLMKKLLKLKIRWFNTTKKTRISYKLSYDINLLDTKISYKLQDMLESFMFCLAGMIILNYVYLGVMAIITIILFFYVLSKISAFLKTIQSLSKFKSEYSAEIRVVYNYINNEILNFRLSKKSNLLKDVFMETTNELQRAKSHIAFYASRWLAIRMIIFNTTLMTAAYAIPLAFLYFLNDIKFFERSILVLAFSMSWSLKITDYFNRYINALIEVYTDIVSFGRMKNFVENCVIEDRVEAEIVSPFLMIERQNPSKKETEREGVFKEIVRFEDVSLTLSGRKVLNQIGMVIREGEKIVIAGEHGAGKTTLFKLIMSLYEKDENKNSKMVFFGQNVEDINPRKLRGKIGYLENNPVVFSGSVRENIDPDHRYKEDDIIAILNEFGVCELIEFETTEEGKIEVNYKKSIHDGYKTDGNGITNLEQKRSLNGILNSDRNHLDKESKTLTNTPIQKTLNPPMEEDENEDEIENNEKKNILKIGSVAVKITIGLVSETNKKLIRKFLKHQLNAKERQVPLNVRKLLKAAKTYLENPLLLLVHQPSLSFNLKKKQKILELFSHLNNGKTTIIFSMSKFDNLLNNWERAIVLDKGNLVEDGKVVDLLRSKQSKFGEILEKSDKRVYEKLFVDLKRVLITERNKREEVQGVDQDGYRDFESEVVDEDVFVVDPRLYKGNLGGQET